MTVEPGAIVWASVPDKNGHVKDRPLVVMSIGTESDPTIVCSCITTRDEHPRPKTYVRVPWDARGRSSTGLRQPSFAVADWPVTIRRSMIRRRAGELSEQQMSRLVSKIAKAQ